MEDEYIWITKNGIRIKIKPKQSYMDAYIRQAAQKQAKETKFFNEEQTTKEAKKITNKLGRLNCCKEVSEEISRIANERGIDAKPQPVTAIHNGVMETAGTHYVVESNGKLYDYTGKQFFGSNNPNDVEMKQYQNNGTRFYTENGKIKIATIEEAINHTEKNKKALILYK